MIDRESFKDVFDLTDEEFDDFFEVAAGEQLEQKNIERNDNPEFVEIEDGPNIHYIPDARNHYNFRKDVVVLDSNLKKYPKAHKVVKEHELKHAESDGFWYNLGLEWGIDKRRFFEDSEEMREFREYIQNEIIESDVGTEGIETSLINSLREFWTVWIFGPVSMLKGKLGNGGDDDE